MTHQEAAHLLCNSLMGAGVGIGLMAGGLEAQFYELDPDADVESAGLKIALATILGDMHTLAAKVTDLGRQVREKLE